jgi:hypothetical protein
MKDLVMKDLAMKDLPWQDPPCLRTADQPSDKHRYKLFNGH